MAIILGGTSSVRAQTPHEEKFIVYAAIGPVFMTGDDSEVFKTGLHIGGGIGWVFGTFDALSIEGTARIDHHTLPLQNEQFTPNGTKTNEDANAVTFEGRFRFETRRWLRPYVSVGVGLYDFDGAALFALGMDIATDQRRLRPIYVELRYIGTDISFLRLDFGLRLG